MESPLNVCDVKGDDNTDLQQQCANDSSHEVATTYSFDAVATDNTEHSAVDTDTGNASCCNTDSNLVSDEQSVTDVQHVDDKSRSTPEPTTETALWDCTTAESEFMSSCNTDISNTQLSNESITQQSTPKKAVQYIYVKPDKPETYARPLKRKISTTQSHTHIDLLQVKVDCLIEKLQHAATWTATYLRHGDTDSAIQELQSVQETLKHSKTSIHQSCAKVRQQLQ